MKQKQCEILLEDFKSYYGAHPIVLAQAWEELQTTTIPAARIDTTKKRSVHLKNFIRANQFLKQYQTEKQRKVQFGNTEKTIRKWTRYFLERLQALREAKVRERMWLAVVSLISSLMKADTLLCLLLFTDCLARRQ